MAPRILSDDIARGKLFRASYHWADLYSEMVKQNKKKNRLRATRKLYSFFREAEIPEDLVSDAELLEIMEEWSVALDKAFFFGNLRRHIMPIEFDSVITNYGLWKPRKRIIILNPSLHRKDMTDNNHNFIWSMITTVIHEMMHAYFDVFAAGDITVSP